MTKNIFGLGSVLLFGTTHGIRPSKEGFPGPIDTWFRADNFDQIRDWESFEKSLYDRESDSNNGYNGRFWTGWSEWYGCPSFPETKLNPFGLKPFDRKYFWYKIVLGKTAQLLIQSVTVLPVSIGPPWRPLRGAVLPSAPFIRTFGPPFQFYFRLLCNSKSFQSQSGSLSWVYHGWW